MNYTGDAAMKTTYGEKLQYALMFLERKGIKYTPYSSSTEKLHSLPQAMKIALATQFQVNNPTAKNATDKMSNLFRTCVAYPPQVVQLIMYVNSFQRLMYCKQL